MGAFLTYALDEGGALVHVDNVANGAKCACHCPYCNAPLYAKNKGKWPEEKTRIHHFAHAPGHECEGAFESSLHLLAKEILRETGCIMLPSSEGDVFPSGSTRVHNIQVEKWDSNYGIRPDAEGIMDNGERLLIEFYVSHKIDSQKRQIIVDNHLKCIEININYQVLSKEGLMEFLMNSDEDRKWIVPLPTPKLQYESYSYSRNPFYNEIRDIIKQKFEEGTLLIHPFKSSQIGSDRSFNLRKYGYDSCKVNTSYQRIKSDLLLCRSKKEDKGYISINVRRRARYNDFSYPTDLRIIDVIVNLIYSNSFILDKVKDGDLKEGIGLRIDYYGFKENAQESKKESQIL